MVILQSCNIFIKKLKINPLNSLNIWGKIKIRSKQAFYRTFLVDSIIDVYKEEKDFYKIK